MNPRRLLKRLFQGQVANVDFDDARLLLVTLGFRHQRTSGSHHIYAHPAVPSVVSIQSVRGQAKPYQLRQLVGTIRRYNLGLEDGS